MKKVSSSHYKVFGFMINPHEMLIISEEGQKLCQFKVESDGEAKEKFMGEVLNQQLISTLGRTDFSTIWVDDPAGDPNVVDACAKMEQGQADQLLSDAINGQEEQHPEETTASSGELPAPAPETAEELPAPQFPATPKTKIIEVECAETYSEQQIKNFGRRIRALKAEALQSAAEFREDIKKLEKQFFEMCDGKSFTQMECAIETNWEAGIRRYIRPDTGGVAKEEQIPWEERQLKMDLSTPGNPEGQPAEQVEETASPEEPVVDETKPSTNETIPAENETLEYDDPDDFPPPEETEEATENVA